MITDAFDQCRDNIITAKPHTPNLMRKGIVILIIDMWQHPRKQVNPYLNLAKTVVIALKSHPRINGI